MIKKAFLSILMVVLLTGCSLGSSASDDAAMATRVAEIIASSMPPTLTPIVLPTYIEPTQPPLVEVTLAPTVTPLMPTEAVTLVVDTPTVEASPTLPVDTPTSGPVIIPSPTGIPTAIIPPTDLRLKLGTPTAADPMDSPDLWVWPSGLDTYTSATWKNGAMTLTGLTSDSGWRMPTTTQSSSIYIEMVAKPEACVGNDNYGIIFRVPTLKLPDQGYLFGVSCDGQYALWKWDGKSGENGLATRLVQWTSNSVILTGANQVNRLGVLAVGSNIKLYVNGIFLAEVNDSTFASGYFGAYINPDTTTKFAVQIDQVSYWLNPAP